MQQIIKYKWLHKSFVFLLSILVATSFMVPGSFGAFGAQEARAAGDEPVLLNEHWIDVEDVGDGEHGEITYFNFVQGESPQHIIIPAFYGDLQITKIGKGVFSNTDIKSVQFQEGSAVSEIGESAFENTPIERFQFTQHLTKIGKYAFKSGKSFTKVDLRPCSGLVTIPEDAFYNAGVNELYLPPSLKTIGTRAFESNWIVGTLTIPKTVTSIAYNALNHAGANNNFTLDLKAFAPGAFDFLLESWSNHSFKIKWDETNKYTGNETPFLFDTQSKLIYGLKDNLKTNDYGEWWTHPTTTAGVTTGGTLKIPSSIGEHQVKGFAMGALGYSSKTSKEAIKKIVFEEGHTMESFSRNSFFGLSNMTEMENIPATVTTIEEYALSHTSIKDLRLPGVTEFASNGYGLGSLRTVTFESNAVSSISDGAFRISSAVNVNEINLKAMEKNSVSGAPWGCTAATVH